MTILAIVVGWSVVLIVDLLAAIVLMRMATGAIDLTMLLSERNGDASISRFQLLVFTYVIGLTLFWVTIARTPPAFPEITGGLLSLMGISASTYAVSKGLQTSAETGITVSLDRTTAALGPGQQVTFTATVSNAQNANVAWSHAPAIGSLSVTGNRATYAAPPAPAALVTVTVTASSVQSPAVSASATVQL